MLAAMAGIFAACERDQPTAVKPGGPDSRRTSVSPAPAAVHYEPEKVVWDLVSRVPGVGGVSIDSTGQLVVFLIDTTTSVSARAGVAQWLLVNPVRIRNHITTSLPILVRQGDYDFPHLAGWRDQIVKNLLGNLSSVVAVGIDHRTDRIWIGNDPRQAGADATIAAGLAAMGIPSAAVVLIPELPSRATGLGLDVNELRRGMMRTEALSRRSSMLTQPTLVDEDGFYRGGEQITSAIGTCTGFVVDFDGTRYAATNSHCTRTWAAVDSTDEYLKGQNGGFVYFAKEKIDPSVDRYSDFALLRDIHDPTVTTVRGSIARPTNKSGSRDIDTNKPPLTIVTEAGGLVTGTTVSKVGRTTGWSDGVITDVCTFESQSGNTRKCQVRASYARDEGDSGSPVFAYESDDAVDLAGIHWGQSVCPPLPGCTDRAIYSPMSGIRSDLGAPTGRLNVTTEIALSAMTVSGTSVYSSACGGNAAHFSWPSVTVSGTSWPLTYKVFAQVYYGNGVWGDQMLMATLSSATTSWTDTFCNAANTVSMSAPDENLVSSWTVWTLTAYDSGVLRNSSPIYAW
jgi:hypothetical protein